MSYDVYYSTGGVSNIGGGSDVWVRHWIEEIAPAEKTYYVSEGQTIEQTFQIIHAEREA